MNAKTLRYTGSKGFFELLALNFPKPIIRVAGDTHHFSDRFTERPPTESQKAILFKVKLGIVRFSFTQVSEIRVFRNFIVSVVIDDVVFAYHPQDLVTEAIHEGFGIREGAGFAVVKTILSYPNVRPKHNGKFIDGFEIV